MAHPASITCEGAFRVPLPLERARDLFTPEGERSWVEGWDPAYRSTALTEERRPELAEFAAGFEDYLGSWREAILASLGRSA